jgi:phenylalanyl-tRNA synthetase alpha chain
VRAVLAELREAALAEIAGVEGEDGLEAIRLKYLGRNGSLNAVLRGLGQLPADERPAMGALANDVKGAVTTALDVRRDGLEAERLRRSLAEERLDVTLPGRARPRGHVHPLRAMEDEIVDVFVSMGFQVVEGPEIEDDFHNFGALNVPPDHPARDMQDTFYLEGGDEALLRTHTSPVQIRCMQAMRPPLQVIVPGTVYRRDDLDATHSPMFQQVEGLWVDERVTFADLKGVLVHFLQRLYGTTTPVRFRPSFFPFTEPSGEVDIGCLRCARAAAGPDSACRVCKGTGWLEILGCGMVHPNVLRAVGYDPERVRGFAFGMGIERPLLLRLGLEELRAFYDNDVRFLGQF